MAEALIGGITSGLTTSDKIFVSDPVAPRLKYLEEKFPGVTTTADNKEVVRQSDIIILAVKPQVFAQAINSLKGVKLEGAKMFVSIMAGVTLTTLVAQIEQSGVKADVIRVMPNTPSLVMCGSAAFVLPNEGHLSHEGENAAKVPYVKGIFSSIGVCEQVGKEELMDAVTGLSGSGPAYVYMLIEAMADGGVKNGLPRDVALKLAANTVMGSAKMVMAGVKEEGGFDMLKHPGVLKNAVESPGGTTIAGTAALEQHGFRGAVISAVTAATTRSRELGNK
uniref:Pyrroline-5-carboxylate reductase n=1 Tax=Haptolina brevifila TaxID=156173 RepID=A0A7S2NKT7_9EUKA